MYVKYRKGNLDYVGEKMYVIRTAIILMGGEMHHSQKCMHQLRAVVYPRILFRLQNLLKGYSYQLESRKRFIRRHYCEMAKHHS